MIKLGLASVAVAVVTAAGCAASDGESSGAGLTEPSGTEPTAIVSSTTTTPATTTTQPPAPNGRSYPVVPNEIDELVAELVRVELALHDEATAAAALPDLGHTQQMLYRMLGRHPEWDADVFNRLPPGMTVDVADHLGARRAFIDLVADFDPPADVPAWEIVEPEPLADLRSYYEEAEAATGIEWEYLAGINLVETGMGRIVGLSTAGARGPMQFIPTTWDEVGEGSIDDPHDSIQAAARYLVRRGGPDDMNAALWGYNNADEYVTAVSHYADLLRRDERNLIGIYHWEIHYFAAIGDLWLPVGYRSEQAQPASDYVSAAPWSAPPEGDR